MEPSSKNGERVWISVSIGLYLIIVAGGLYLLFGGNSDEYYAEGGECNVIGLDVHGCIATYAPDPNLAYDTGCDLITSSGELTAYLSDAQTDERIRGVLLDIDSSGGTPQAAYEIEQALEATGKPSVALIRGYGTSAAYWVASGADTIIASPESEVGSIGVTSSYVDYAKQNAQDGVTFNALSTGKFKDMGNPDKPLTADERDRVEDSLYKTFEHFIRTVAENRGMTPEQVRELADGSSVLGEEALQKGLIDMLGTHREALTALESAMGEDAVICWPQYSTSEGY